MPRCVVAEPPLVAPPLVRLSHDAGRSTWRFDVAPWAARATAESGVGLFAARAIAHGERLLAESPMATWRVAAEASDEEKRRSFQAMSSALPRSTVDAIMALSQSRKWGETQTLLGTWQTNGLPINYESGAATTSTEILSRREAAVFANICRLNHACRPNCHAEWNARLGQETVHALRDIRPGEELTICYLEPRGSERAHRRARLAAEHGFDCCCGLCELRGEALATSEARQRALGELSRPDEREMPVAALAKRLDIRLRLMAQEGLPALWAWKPVLFHLVTGSMAELMRDETAASRRRADAWAQRACACLVGALGADHSVAELITAFVRMVDESMDEPSRADAQRHFVAVAEAAFKSSSKR